MALTWKPPYDGWHLGTLGREAAFTDGHAMFVGTRKGKINPVQRKRGAFNHVVKECLVKRLVPTEIVKHGEVDGRIPCVMLRGGTWIQEIYYNYAMRIKGVNLFLGRVWDGNDRAVICKVGKKIVGIIMPIRAPEGK